jgi:hypothetical protein
MIFLKYSHVTNPTLIHQLLWLNLHSNSWRNLKLKVVLHCVMSVQTESNSMGAAHWNQLWVFLQVHAVAAKILRFKVKYYYYSNFLLGFTYRIQYITLHKKILIII